MAVTLRKYGILHNNPVEAEQLDFSVIIPVYNEESNIEPLFEALKPVIQSTGRSCEVIFIDDGSKDDTYKVLQKLNQSEPLCKVIKFRRNFGQTAAMAAGFANAHGSIIITLDGDLQNDPQDIPMLLSKIEEGYDVVSGWRVHRKDKFITRRLPSICANWLISRITGVRLHDYGCTLKAYRREVAQNIGLYGEMHRFIPAMASWMGVSVAEVEVNHHPRKFGKSKYGLSRTLRVILDLIAVKFLLSYSTKPLQIFGTVGFLSSITGLAVGTYLSIDKLVFNHTLSNRPMLFLAILLMLVGVQLVTMGLLGEMMVRIYHEGQDKPIYVIKDFLE
ncbi:MAG: glycosyltransferase family 2 protein [Armatimonadota bacterium]